MKLLGIIVFICGFNYFFSQGNLQYNQIYNFSGTLSNIYPSTNTNNNGYSHGISPLTVPASKVWRIERLWIQGTNNPSVFINNLCIIQAMNNVEVNLVNPIWMKSGDILRLGGIGPHLYSINVVEFNVIP
jgi:hypothetical protein